MKSWTTASATVKETEATAKDLSAKLETEMGAVQAEDAVPELSPELDKQIADLRQKTTIFMATKPAPNW